MDITPAQIQQEIWNEKVSLTKKNMEYQRFQADAAIKERNYRIANRQCMLQLKSTGNSITLIPALAAGDEKVSQLKMEWDLAVAMSKTCRNAIHNIRSTIDGYRSILSSLKTEFAG